MDSKPQTVIDTDCMHPVKTIFIFPKYSYTGPLKKQLDTALTEGTRVRRIKKNLVFCQPFDPRIISLGIYLQEKNHVWRNAY